MFDLSIVISAQHNSISYYTTLLKPLRDTYHCEIICITNDSIDLSSAYDYQVIPFHDTYAHFTDFCLSSTLGKRVMIIEDGLALTPDFVAFLVETLHKDPVFNITCTVETLLCTQTTESFIHEQVIVYNRGIHGFNIPYTKAPLCDSSLLKLPLDHFATPLFKLKDPENHHFLYTWLSYYLPTLSHTDQAHCYTILEYNKWLMADIDWHDFEELFLLDTPASLYSHYLTCRHDYQAALHTPSTTIETLQNLSISQDDLYFSWLLKDFISLQKSSELFLECLDQPVLKSLILYLLDHDHTSWNAFASFAAHLPSLNSKKQIKAVIFLFVTALNYMSQHTMSPEDKEVLLDFLDSYLTLGHQLITAKQFPHYISHISCKKERHFILALRTAADTDATSCIATAWKLSRDYPDRINLLCYYIQKVRYTHKSYSKVLSICMIMRDEAKNLERCLSSVTPLIDQGLAELVIVDTGSVDRSIAIAQRYTDKIYCHEWENSFSKARNQSLQYCNGEYVFILDADEELPESAIQGLMATFTGTEYTQFDTFMLNVISYTVLTLDQYAVMAQPRIFRNDCRFHYSSAVHNQPVCTPPVKTTTIDILHYGYIMTPDIREKKYIRTTTLLKKEIQNNPRHIYFHFQLSTSYAMYGDLKKALNQTDLYMRLIEEEVDLYDNVLMYYNNAAAVYINTFNYDKAEAVCDAALAIEPNFIDFIYYKAFILFEHHDYEQALQYILKYLDLIPVYNQLETANDGRFAFYTICSLEEVKRLLLQTHFRLHMYNECIQDIYTITSESLMINCLYEWITACLFTQNKAELEKFHSQFIRPSSNPLFQRTFDYFLSVIEDDAPKNDFYQLDTYAWDGLEFEEFWPFLYEVIAPMLTLDTANIQNRATLISYKKIFQLILHRTRDLVYDYLSEENMVDLFNNYMFVCSQLTRQGDYEDLEVRELAFINKVILAYQSPEPAQTHDLLREATMEYHDMNGIIDLSIDILFDTSSFDQARDFVSPDTLASSPSPEPNTPSDAELQNAVLTLLTKNNETLEEDFADLSQLIAQLELSQHSLAAKISLCRLYAFTKQYDKALNTYIQLKLHHPTEIPLEIAKLIPASLLASSAHTCSILQGTMDITKNTVTAVQLLKNHGMHVDTLNYIPRQCPAVSDYEMDVNAFENGQVILERTIDVANFLIPRYDIFHFHHHTSLQFNHTDLSLLHELHKQIIVQYCAEDLYFQDEQELFDKLQILSQYATCCIVDDYMTYTHVKDFFEDITVIAPFAMTPLTDTPTVTPCDTPHTFKIVHSPHNRTFAGTTHLLEVIEALKVDFEFEFEVVDNLALDEAYKVYQSADLIIDELIAGTYSTYAIEAMAINKPFMGYISPLMKTKYGPELPFIPTTPETLYADLKALLEDPAPLAFVKELGRSYVQKYHHPHTQTLKLIALYQQICSH